MKEKEVKMERTWERKKKKMSNETERKEKEIIWIVFVWSMAVRLPRCIWDTWKALGCHRWDSHYVAALNWHWWRNDGEHLKGRSVNKDVWMFHVDVCCAIQQDYICICAALNSSITCSRILILSFPATIDRENAAGC